MNYVLEETHELCAAGKVTPEETPETTYSLLIV
jgi:hypothetical protein